MKAKKIKQARYPFTFIIENTTKDVKLAKLFGHRLNKIKANLGSDKGIKITYGQAAVTYAQALDQSKSQMDFDLIEVYGTIQQCALPVTIYSEDEKLQSCTLVMHDENVTSGVAKHAMPFRVCEDVELQLLLLPKQITVVKVYPKIMKLPKIKHVRK